MFLKDTVFVKFQMLCVLKYYLVCEIARAIGNDRVDLTGIELQKHEGHSD
jgi:hypothetical protein